LKNINIDENNKIMISKLTIFFVLSLYVEYIMIIHTIKHRKNKKLKIKIKQKINIVYLNIKKLN